MSAHATYLAQRSFGALDALRCLSIVAVVWHHSGPFVDAVPISGRGFLGVDLFFVISGYIITTMLLREERKTESADARGFLMRRALRLWPLYFAVLLIESFLVFGLRAYSHENQALFSEKLTCYVLYCSNWLETSGEGPFFVAWSLAAIVVPALAVPNVAFAVPPNVPIVTV